MVMTKSQMYKLARVILYTAAHPQPVVCLLVDKVYDECKNVRVDEVGFVMRPARRIPL